MVDGIERKDRKVQKGRSRLPAIATPAKKDGKRNYLFTNFHYYPQPHFPNYSAVMENYI